jgi:galactokinase/mevalonate kinase-like predicted kinase
MKNEVPLRVDFGGGWLDVPKFKIEGAFIVNCAITPKVSLENWPYNKGAGLGGSGAWAILNGKESIKSELDLGVGWQDPAVILETGLCVWRSGDKPVLEMKMNPDFLQGKMALYWTGETHNTPNNTDNARNYDLIKEAGLRAYQAVKEKSLAVLAMAIDLSYKAQLDEGMKGLPNKGELAKKYCGGGWGGYALYLFEKRPNDLLNIEPYIK